MDRRYFERRTIALRLREFLKSPGSLVVQVFGRAAAVVIAALTISLLAHVDSRREVYGPRLRGRIDQLRGVVSTVVASMETWDRSLDDGGAP